MTGIVSRIFSRITSALEANAAQRPTHFPAIKSAQELETGKETPQSDEVAEKKDASEPE